MTTLRVTVQGETFTVEVQDPLARPVVALVEGERFEVWPEADEPVATAAAPATTAPMAAAAPPSAHSPNGQTAAAGLAVLAPLPGVIATISVRAGDAVTVGQELLAIEAMKMKNVVRAARAGSVAQVLVAPGQSVQHRQVLVEYA